MEVGLLSNGGCDLMLYNLKTDVIKIYYFSRPEACEFCGSKFEKSKAHLLF